MEEENFTMSLSEADRIGVLEQVKSKAMTQAQGAMRIGLGKRQMIRLCQQYAKKGPTGILSKRRGKPSNNQIKPELKAKCLTLIKAHYPDVGPTLAHEKLTEVHKLKLSVETVRKLMISAELWKRKKRKTIHYHPQRLRRHSLGELIQIDGSPHDWFEGRGPRCSLLVFIDDATSKLMMLRFVPEESTEGYFCATKNYLMQHGRPMAFYSDRHCIFRVNIKEAKTGTGDTEFSRAMKELGIELICANSPQAKGRVEKTNRTLQDRLVKELRLKGISDIDTANDFVQEFMADYNKRFSVEPACSEDVHRKTLPEPNALNLLLSKQCSRKLTKNLEMSYNNVIYQVVQVG